MCYGFNKRDIASEYNIFLHNMPFSVKPLMVGYDSGLIRDQPCLISTFIEILVQSLFFQPASLTYELSDG